MGEEASNARSGGEVRGLRFRLRGDGMRRDGWGDFVQPYSSSQTNGIRKLEKRSMARSNDSDVSSLK